MDATLVNFLSGILGDAKYPDREWVYFACPFCLEQNKYKVKLAINSNSYAWKCWVCQQHGSNLYSLLRKLNKWYLKDELTSILKNYSHYLTIEDNSNYNNLIQLPSEFIPLSSNQKFIMKNKALKYLKKRNIGQYEIYKYNIGICESGKYQNRIIIPSYNKYNQLNYFTARTMDNEVQPKYLNPRGIKKDEVVVFQSLINWEYPVVLVQGIFDAMTVNFNSIPLLGKTVNKALLQTILLYDAQVIVALDNDAYNDELKLLKKLYKSGINNLYYLFLDKNNKDPNTMGCIKFWDYLNKNIKQFNENSELDILKYKLN